MKIIADSGATKTDWVIVDEAGNQTEFSTKGLNPNFTTSTAIIKELNKSLKPKIQEKKISSVYFYGAGCKGTKQIEKLKKPLLQIFPKASIYVKNDLDAAARALCFHDAGIACILGTGSNSCLYDGKNIIDHIANLGYLLGDEGSAAHLGKKLLTAYFYRELSHDLEKKVSNLIRVDRDELIKILYVEQFPNLFLASFGIFFSENIENPEIKKIVISSFAEFINRHVLKYKGHSSLPIHFTGSIAYFFRDILSEVIAKNNLTLGRVIRKPINNLIKFHTSS